MRSDKKKYTRTLMTRIHKKRDISEETIFIVLIKLPKETMERYKTEIKS